MDEDRVVTVDVDFKIITKIIYFFVYLHALARASYSYDE